LLGDPHADSPTDAVSHSTRANGSGAGRPTSVTPSKAAAAGSPPPDPAVVVTEPLDDVARGVARVDRVGVQKLEATGDLAVDPMEFEPVEGPHK